MTATRRRGGPAPVGPGLGTAAFRGALLIVAAVALGAGLLAKSFGDGGPTHTGGVTSGTTTTTASTTPSTQPVQHNPADVKVLVLNGVDRTKAIAGPAAAALKSLNYVTLTPADAKTNVQTTAVYYQPGYQADAAAIAAKLGVPSSAVQALPSPLPPSVDAVADANVIAVVGPDSTYGKPS